MKETIIRQLLFEIFEYEENLDVIQKSCDLVPFGHSRKLHHLLIYYLN